MISPFFIKVILKVFELFQAYGAAERGALR
jgi:hypothetical protein